jgi:D-alanyl-D-alanine carboxypeptidase
LNRRHFLKFLSVGTVASMAGELALRGNDDFLPVVYEDMSTSPAEMLRSIQFMKSQTPDAKSFLLAFQNHDSVVVSAPDNHGSYKKKMDNFEHAHHEDVFLAADKHQLLVNTFKRLDRVQNLVGHGNFNVLSFDEMIGHSKHYESVGRFKPEEIEFLEETFSDNVMRFGFYGERVTDEITAIVAGNERIKVPSTGHYLFKGDSLNLYKKVRRDLGDNVVLTSGIRSVVKQSHLFMAKTIQSRGNLSKASRSLAPPGHSFHGVGDFDVGKVGFGTKNFSAEFAQTDEFKKLVDLGYVAMRYPKENLLGVRFEPWHIKVA